MLTIWLSGLLDYASLESLKTHKDALQLLADEYPVLGPLAFILGYAVVVALSLPVASLLTLLGGFLFGSVWGTAAVVLGATAGATTLFLIARSSLGETLRQKAGPLYKRVAKDMEESHASYLLFLRLVPLFPFVLVNILPALFQVRLLTYIWTTVVGILPGSFIYVNLGTALGDINTLSDLISKQTLLAFGLLGVLALMPVMLKKMKGFKNGRKTKAL